MPSQVEIDKLFMRQAIELSRKNMLANRGGPFGAVIARGDQHIAEGSNQVTSLNDPTAHAEVSAIRSACNILSHFDLSGHTIYTSCEPCPMCLAAIYWARLDRIVFANSRSNAADIGFDDDFIYQEIPLPLADRSIPTHQLLATEGISVFEQWTGKTDKIPY